MAISTNRPPSLPRSRARTVCSSSAPTRSGSPVSVSRSIARRPAYALTDGRYKFLLDVRRGAQELYDLERDPHEREDLGAREPLRLAALREALYRFILDRAGGSAEAPAPPLSAEEREQLRALGYIN